MSDLRQYILSVIAAAIIVAISGRLTVNNHAKKVIKMVAGLVFSVVLLSPVGNTNISSYLSYFDTVDFEARESVSYGENIYQDNLKVIIQQRCEAYILDKAKLLGATINVNVQCDTSEIPTPTTAEISGSVSPYVRRMLQGIIAEDIGIPEEKQLWI